MDNSPAHNTAAVGVLGHRLIQKTGLLTGGCQLSSRPERFNDVAAIWIDKVVLNGTSSGIQIQLPGLGTSGLDDFNVHIMQRKNANKPEGATPASEEHCLPWTVQLYTLSLNL